MYQIDKLVNLQIGVQGENVATDIEVDMTAWAEKFPGARFHVLFKPYNEDYPLPMASDYDSETNVLTWHITFSATAIVGVGYTEIRAIDQDTALVKKTRIIPTVVEHSVSGLGTDDPPEPYEDWVNTVLAAKDTAVAAKDTAVDSKEAAETARDAAQAAAGDFQGLTATATGLAAGSDPTVSVTHSEGGLYNMAFGIPKGEKGETGDPAPSDQVVPAVSSYLSQVITNPDSPPLDRTLASANAAAPADMVGDLNSAISPIAFVDPNWTDGKYLFVNSSHVISEQTNENYAISDYIFVPAGSNVLIHTYFSGNARAVLYDKNKTWLNDYSNTSGIIYGLIDISITKASVDRYVRTSCYIPKKDNAFVSVYESLSDIVEDISDANSSIVNRVKIYGERITSSTQLSSLADAEPNTVYTINGTIEESQPSAAGTMLTLNSTNDNNGGHAQIFIATNGKVYTRIKWSRTGGVVFSAWKKVLDVDDEIKYMKPYGSRITSSSQLSSLADAEPNKVYTFTTKVEESQPEESGTLLTLNCTNDNNGGHAQIFISGTNNIYFRIKWSHSGSVSFFNWVKLAKSSDITTLQNEIESIVPKSYADATMFLRIGVVGDSFASGVIYPSDYVSGSEANYTHYEQSWPQCLGRLCGNTVINYSVGGCTTKSWLTNYTYGKHKMETDDPCNLYILCLGINDSGLNSQQEPRVPIGSESDIGTEEDSFWRWYGDIVAAIKAHAPNALIVFSTFRRKNYSDAETTRVNSYNDAIQDIAEHYRVPCLVLTDDSFFNSEYYLEGMQNRHPTAPQYSGYARAINRLIAGSIKDNYSYYSDYNSEPI